MGLLPNGVDLFRSFVFLTLSVVFLIGPALVQSQSLGTESWHPLTASITVIGVTISVIGLVWYTIGKPVYLKTLQPQ